MVPIASVRSDKVFARAASAAFILVHIGCVSEPAEPDYDPSGGGGKGDVWGDDDRKERYELDRNGVAYQLALSSAMVADSSQIAQYPADGHFELIPPNRLAAVHDLCPGERFARQPSVGFCSATLVAPNLVVTSGHCLMRNGEDMSSAQSRCNTTMFAFNFAYDEPTADQDLIRAVFNLEHDVYSCKSVLAIESPYTSTATGTHDYAIVELDRPVVGHTPIPVANVLPSPGDPVVQIGHPSGIPQKISSDAVGEPFDRETYKTAFTYHGDLLGGDSGGGVFSESDGGVLMGIPTVYSGQDYVLDPARGCYVTAVCGSNAECPLPPGAYSTKWMLQQIPSQLAQRLTIAP
jgi:V8-like Glu-specific endopeptidase